MIKSSNPALTRMGEASAHTGESMSINGTINVTGILTAIVFVTAIFSFNSVAGAQAPSLTWWQIGGAIAGFVLALVIIFKPTMARLLSPVYAAAQGVFLGAVSAVFEMSYPGIVFQAVVATICVMFVMLVSYRMGWIRATEKFKSIVFAATGGIALVYLVSIVLGFFGVNMTFLHDSSPLSIGISLFVVCIAALNLILDFDAIESAVAQGYPKYYNWYGAFSLLVTLVWLYLEMLRLISKLRSE